MFASEHVGSMIDELAHPSSRDRQGRHLPRAGNIVTISKVASMASLRFHRVGSN